MDNALATTIITTSGAIITGAFGMFITVNQLGRRMDDLNKRMDDLNKRMDDLNKRMDDLRTDIRDLRTEFYTFKDVITGKLATLDMDIAKLMDRRNPQ